MCPDDGGDDGNLTLLTPCWYVPPIILSGDILSMSDAKEWSDDVFFLTVISSSPADWFEVTLADRVFTTAAVVLDGLHTTTLPFVSAWN